jgi:hypothetical protein
MRNIYDNLDQIEKHPGMYLGNDYGIIALNLFVTGFLFGGGKFYDKKQGYPDFCLFSNWLGGILKYKFEKSGMNWCWLLLDKYKDDKIAFEKFFFYLKQFKETKVEVIVVPLTKANIHFSIKHGTNQLWCKVGRSSKTYFYYLRKIDKLILFKIKPSRTLFTLMVNINNKVLETRNSDMTGKVLRIKIEEQFGIELSNWKALNANDSKTILRQFKII